MNVEDFKKTYRFELKQMWELISSSWLMCLSFPLIWEVMNMSQNSR